MPISLPARSRMGSARLSAARTWAHGALVASIALTIAVSVALLCALTAWIALETRAALREAVAGEDRYALVQTRVADDTGAQDAAADALFTSLFADAAEVERIELGEPGSDTARVAWRITPSVDLLDQARLERLRRGVAALPEAFRSSDAAVQGSLAGGDLGAALDEASLGITATTAIAPVPLALVGVLAWFAVLELSRLLGGARGRESALLRGRGLSRSQAAVLTGGEAAAVAVAAAGVGFGGALAGFALAGGMPGVAAVAGTWPLALGAILVLAPTMGLQAARAARAAGSAHAAAGRTGRAATAGAAVLIVLAAAVALWQAGATRDLAPDDRWRVLVMAVAPTLGVAAVAVLAIVVFAPLSAIVARAGGARPGVSPSYPARQVARRVVAFSTAIALVAIAVAGAVVSGAYTGTWHVASDEAARLSAGAALRADSAGAVTPESLLPAAEVAGVDRVAPALTAGLVVGDASAEIVAVPGDAIADVVLPVPGVVDPAALAAVLAVESGSASLPDEATGLRLTATVTSTDPDAAAVRVRAWVADATGAPMQLTLSRVTLEENAGGPGRRLTADGDLPDGAGPWRMLSIDVARDLRFPGVTVTLDGIAVAATAGEAELAIDVVPTASVQLFGFPGSGVSEAIVWSGAGTVPDRTPAVVTSSLAGALALEVGGPLDVRFEGTGRTAALVIAGIVPAVAGAGTPDAVMVAYDVLSQNFLNATRGSGPLPTVLPPDGVWAAGDAAAAEPLSDALGTPVRTPTDVAAAMTAGLIPVWFAAALGGAVLAGLALVALLTALAGQRAGEVLVLRALGIGVRRQSRMRLVEASVVVLLATVLGAAGGVALAWLAVPVMVEAAVPGAALAGSGPAVVFDALPIAVALVALAVAFVVAALSSAATIRAQGASTRLEEAAP